MVIDVHAHHIPAPFNSRYLEWATKYNKKDYGPVYLWNDPAFEDLSLRLDRMEENGIDLSLVTYSANIVQIVESMGEWGFSREAAVREINDAMRKLAAENKDRLKATALIEPCQREAALKEMERCQESCYGYSILCAYRMGGKLEFLDHPCFAPFWEKANELGKPVWIHFSNLCRLEEQKHPLTGYMSDSLLSAGLGQLMENSICLTRLVLSGIFDRYPKLRIVMGQLAGMYPFMMERFGMLYGMYRAGGLSKELPLEERGEGEHILRNLRNYTDQVYVDTHSMGVQAIECAAEIIGEEHIMYGSDYPITPDNFGMRHALAGFQESNMPKDRKEKILGGNAAKLLGL